MLQTTYSLNENDYLTHQLYLATKSERITKKRTRSRIVAALLYIAGAAYFLIKGSVGGAIIFLLLAILWYFISPYWDKKRYYNHYKAYIKETYKERINIPVTITILHDYLVASDSGSESKIATTEIVEIIELPTLFLIKLSGASSIPIPKHHIHTNGNFARDLKNAAIQLNVRYIDDTNWKWH